MKKMLVVAAVALLSLPASAAIQYEFFQKSTTEGDAVPSTDMTARALVDGSRTRIDVVGGNVYPPGCYIITDDATKRMLFIDTVNKSYTEFNAASAATAIGSSNIKIENRKSDVVKLDDHLTIAGHTTDHYRLTLSYDITVVFRSMPLKQSVRTVVDKWTTSEFGKLGDAGIAGNLHTGNSEIDAIVELENTRIPGFALRQNVSVTTIDNTTPVPGSELKFPATRVVNRELWVTKIQQTATDASQFVLPATYTRADAPELKPAAQVLDMKPAGK
ncbi:MAG TPA: hypothetical protein VFN10_03340 [Thermoanaerobaculia bacterium]|nr:hypothetical protein [Thermoanaerobaculia bacterium]